MMYRIRDFLGDIQEFGTKEELRAWIEGAKHALFSFGHWNDGQVFVGNSGKLYRDVVDELYQKYELATGKKFDDVY